MAHRGAAIKRSLLPFYQDLCASNLLRDVQNMMPTARVVAGPSLNVHIGTTRYQPAHGPVTATTWLATVSAGPYRRWLRRRASARRSACNRPRPSSS